MPFFLSFSDRADAAGADVHGGEWNRSLAECLEGMLVSDLEGFSGWADGLC